MKKYIIPFVALVSLAVATPAVAQSKLSLPKKPAASTPAAPARPAAQPRPAATPRSQGSSHRATPRVSTPVRSSSSHHAPSAVVMAPENCSGEINNIWIEQGAQNMIVHVDLDIYSAKGVPTTASAYFVYEDNSPVLDINGQFRADDGQVSAFQIFTPSSNDFSHHDLKITIPNNELHISNNAKCKVFVQLYAGSDYKYLSTSDYADFDASSIGTREEIAAPLNQVVQDIEIVDPNKKKFTANGVSFYMAKVEAGTFTMGGAKGPEDDDVTPHKVTLTKDYYIGETEVTQELWNAVMGYNPSDVIEAQRPVTYVSWDDCQRFIGKLNSITGEKFRLPTEAEWEFAAIGGNKSKHYAFSGSSNIDEVAWIAGNCEVRIHKVKEKIPNELGIYDMSGNAWEWVNDWFRFYSREDAVDPQGPDTGYFKIYRGGSWVYLEPQSRPSFRCSDEVSAKNNNISLRLAKD